MELFHSEEQYREYCDDLAGDGYGNEYQRASAQARLENPPRNDQAEAERLTRAGKFVVVYVAPYYCRVTSGIIGEDFSVVASYDRRDEAESHAWSLHEQVCDDATAFVYRLPVVEPVKPYGREDDECPF